MLLPDVAGAADASAGASAGAGAANVDAVVLT